jgi:hypothetical protein
VILIIGSVMGACRLCGWEVGDGFRWLRGRNRIANAGGRVSTGRPEKRQRTHGSYISRLVVVLGGSSDIEGAGG